MLINFFSFNETHPPSSRYQRRATHITLTPLSCARVRQPPSKNVELRHRLPLQLPTRWFTALLAKDFSLEHWSRQLIIITLATRFHSSISRLDFAHPFRDSISIIHCDSISLIHFVTRFCSSISRLNFSHPFRDSFCLSISGPSGALTIEPSDEILLAIANRVQSSSLAGESPLEISRLGDSPKSKPMEGSFSHLRHKHKCTARITVQRKYHFCPCLRPKARSSNIPVTRKTKGELQNKVTMHSYDA